MIMSTTEYTAEQAKKDTDSLIPVSGERKRAKVSKLIKSILDEGEKTFRLCFDKSGGFIFNTTSCLEEATDWLWHKNACIIIRKCKEMINFGIRDMV